MARTTDNLRTGTSDMKSTQEMEQRRRAPQALVRDGVFAPALAAFASGQQDAHAGPREQAKRMYDRLTGTPPSPELLNDLQTRVQTDRVAAAMYIIDDSQTHSSNFYRVTLKNFATPWTNRDQTVFA